jgi:hypothetical protein
VPRRKTSCSTALGVRTFECAKRESSLIRCRTRYGCAWQYKFYHKISMIRYKDTLRYASYKMRNTRRKNTCEKVENLLYSREDIDKWKGSAQRRFHYLSGKLDDDTERTNTNLLL